MITSFETFNFEGFAQSGLSSVQLDENATEFNDEQKRQLYSDFIDGYAQDLSKTDEFKGSSKRNDVLLRTLDDIPDARPFIGLPEPDEEYRVNSDNFLSYVYENNQEGLYEDNKVSLYRDTYLDRIIDNPSHPQYRVPKGVTKSAYKKALSERLDDDLSLSRYDVDATVGDNRTLFDNRFDDQQDESTDARDDEVGIAENIGRGFLGQGVLDTIGKTVEGISSLGNTLATKFGDIRIGSTDENGTFKLFDVISAEEATELVEQSGLSNDAIGRFGQSIQDLGADIAEEADEESTAFLFGSVSGQLGVIALTGAAGGLTAGASGAGIAAGSVGILSGSQYQIEDYENVLLQNEQSFDPDEAASVALWGGAVGSLEAVPGFKAAGRLLGFVDSPSFLKFLDTETNGRLVTSLKRGTTGAIEEGLQEIASEYASNQVAKNIVAYDPERDLYVGLQEAGQIGGAAGFTINSLLGLISGRRSAKDIEPDNVNNQPTQERVEPTLNDEEESSENVIFVDRGNGQEQQTVVTERPTAESLTENDLIDPSEGLEIIVDGEPIDVTQNRVSQESQQTTQQPEATEFTPQQIGNQNGYASRKGVLDSLKRPANKDFNEFVENQDFTIVERDGRFFAETTDTAQVTTPESEQGVLFSLPEDAPSVVFDDAPFTVGEEFNGNPIQNVVNTPDGDTVVTTQAGEFSLASPRDGVESAIVQREVTNRGGTNKETFFRGSTTDRVVNENGFTFVSSSPLVARTYANTDDPVSRIRVGKEDQLTIDLQGQQFTQNSLDATVTDDKGRTFKLGELFADRDVDVVNTDTVVAAANLNGYKSVRFENAVDISSRDGFFEITETVKRDVFEQQNPGVNYDQLKSENPTDPRILEASRVATESVAQPSTVIAIANPDVREGTVSEDYQLNFARTVGQYFNVETEKNLFQESSEGVNTLKSTNSDGVDVDAILNDEETLDDILISTNVTSTLYKLDEGSNSDIGEWDVSDLEPYLNALPPTVRNLIRIHTEPDNPAENMGSQGMILYNQNDGLVIHINAQNTKYSLQDVVDTIAHETAHFNFSSWGDPRFTKLYNSAFDILKLRIEAELGQYLRHYDTTIETATDQQKQLLVNEYFAKHNSNLLDHNSGDLKDILDAEEFQKLQSEVTEGGAVRIVQDLTDGSTQTSKEFIENIVRLQTAANSNRKIHLSIIQNDKAGVKRRVEVRTTPSGKVLNFINDSERAEALDKLINADANKDQNLALKVKFFLNRHLKGFVGSQFLDNRLTILASNGLQSILRNRVSGLRDASNKHKLLSSKLRVADSRSQFDNIDQVIDRLNNFDAQSEADTAPVFDFTVQENGTYEQRLANAGITKKSDLKDAKELDQLVSEGKGSVLEMTQAIFEALDKSLRLATAKVRIHTESGTQGQSVQELTKMTQHISDFKKRFVENYRHREYRAFTPTGVKEVKDIITDFTASDKVGNGIEDRVDAAIKEVSEIKSKLENGKISERKAVREINKQESIIKIGYRKKVIQAWARNETGPRASQAQVNQLIVDRLNEHVKAAEQRGSVGVIKDKLQLIDGVRGRTLDEEKSQDRLMMKFLDPVTEPVEVLVGTLENQNKTLATLNWSIEYAEELFRIGGARFKGADAIGQWRGSPILQSQQEGSILAHIEVPEIIASELKAMLDIMGNNEQNFIEQIFAYTKKNLTVLNVDLGVSNYINNLFLPLMGGSFAYISRIKQASLGSYELWQRKNLIGIVENETQAQMIAREIDQGGLSNSGSTSLDVDVSRSDLFEKFVNAVMDYATPDAVLSQSGKQRVNNSIERVHTIMEEAYSFGDDYSKVLPYILNRELAVTKAQTTIKRENYPNTKKGKERYDRDIVRQAVPEAINRTARETFVWSLAPTKFKQIARSGLNPFTSNFMMHPQQFMRIYFESYSLGIEDFGNMRDAIKNGNDDYASMLKGRIAARFAGMSIVNTGMYVAAQGGIPLASQGLTALINAVTDDDEDLEDGQVMLVNEKLEAMQTIFHQSSYDGDALYSPLMQVFDLNNPKASGWNNLRTDVTQTLAVPPRSDSGDFEAYDFMMGLGNKFLGNQDQSSNLLRKLVLLTTQGAVDQYGRKITKTELLAELNDSFGPVPNWLADIKDKPMAVYDLVTGALIENPTDEEIEKQQDATSELVKTLGFKVRSFDVEKIIQRHGFRLNREWKDFSQDADVRSNLSRLTTGDTVTEDQVSSIIEELNEKTGELDENHSRFVQAYQVVGFSNKYITDVMTKRDDRRKEASRVANKTQVRKLIKGEPIFSDRLRKVIKNKIGDQKALLRNKKNVDPERVMNNIQSLGLALSMVK